jgi:hypothetical protein
MGVGQRHERAGRSAGFGWFPGTGFAVFAHRQPPGQKEVWAKTLLVPGRDGGGHVSLDGSTLPSDPILAGIPPHAGALPRRPQAGRVTPRPGHPDPRFQGRSQCAERSPSAGRWVPIMAAHREQYADRREACSTSLRGKPIQLSGPSGHLPLHFGRSRRLAGQEHDQGQGAEDERRKPDGTHRWILEDGIKDRPGLPDLTTGLRPRGPDPVASRSLQAPGAKDGA